MKNPNPRTRSDSQETTGAPSADRVRAQAGHDEISRRAYELWEQAGRPDARDQEFWHDAVAQLNGTDVTTQAQAGGSVYALRFDDASNDDDLENRNARPAPAAEALTPAEPARPHTTPPTQPVPANKPSATPRIRKTNAPAGVQVNQSVA